MFKTFLLWGVLAVAGYPTMNARPTASDSGESRTAEVDGAKVHYTNYGSGETAFVLVHGWNCDETVWSQQVGPLSEKARVITVDLPGHGQSDKPQIAYTMDLHARALDAVLQNAGVKAAVLIGHSNGTPVIRQFYRRFPEKVRGLVIIDGALRPFGDAAMMEKFIAPMRGRDYEQFIGRFIGGMVASMTEANREEIKSMMARAPQYVAVSEMGGLLDPTLWPPDKIEVPVLMILAKQPAWTADYEEFVRGFIPKLDYRMWEGVSHFLMIDKPAEFNQAVLEFAEKNALLKA